jgi:undecaprenyl-diphosphatase
MSVGEAIVLAIVEGLTEYLPVSSTGHMIIASSVMNIAQDPFTKTFTVCIQLGAILSVVVLYARQFFKSLGFYVKLLVAFVPAAVAGLLLGDHIDNLLERVDVVAYMLVAGGVFFLWMDRLFGQRDEYPADDVTVPVAFKIGLFQTLALVPGVSRSAATIIGGLAQGMSKKAAAEFSFFLAVPTMFAATAYKLYQYIGDGHSFGSEQLTLLALGNAVAFGVALIAIKSFIGFITRHGFRWFGYYRIAVGGAILILYYLGVQLSVV